jgi:hypothetical protein
MMPKPHRNSSLSLKTEINLIHNFVYFDFLKVQMISDLIWLIAFNNLDVNKFHTFCIVYDACDWIPQSIDLIQSIYPKLHYDLKWDLWPCYLSKWNIIKTTMESFPKTKLLVDNSLIIKSMMKLNGHFMDLSWRSLHGIFKSNKNWPHHFHYLQRH